MIEACSAPTYMSNRVYLRPQEAVPIRVLETEKKTIESLGDDPFYGQLVKFLVEQGILIGR